MVSTEISLRYFNAIESQHFKETFSTLQNLINVKYSDV